MIVVSLKDPSQLARIGSEVDAVELRVDLLNLKIEELACLMQQIKLPKILSLRSQRQGGQYAGSKPEQLECLKQLAELKPDYLDVEYDLLPFTQREFPLSQKLLLSFHDWQGVPADLSLLLQRMKFFPAALYKIAVMPNNLSELMRFLDFLGTTKGEVLGIAMGELGKISRQAAKRFGSLGTFACVDEGEITAPGQIPTKLLSERYNLTMQSKQTALYGLIGEPVSQSVSHVTHNYLLRQKGADALYLKIRTPKDELKRCVEWIRRQGFQGVSVTMPHKEAIIPYLDALTPLAETIGAVNTLFWQEGHLMGDNTDAYGGLMALKEQMGTVKGKRLVLLGVGGAAKALAYSAGQEGAELVCVGRDRGRVGSFAERFGGTALTIEEFCLMKPHYDILVNAIPAAFPVAEEAIWTEAVVMTMQMRPLGETFRRPLITGFNMFVHQAVQQWKLWRPDWDSAEVLRLMKCKTLNF